MEEAEEQSTSALVQVVYQLINQTNIWMMFDFDSSFAKTGISLFLVLIRSILLTHWGASVGWLLESISTKE